MCGSLSTSLRLKTALPSSGGGDLSGGAIPPADQEREDSDALFARIHSYTLLQRHELVPGRSRQALCASIASEIGDKVLIRGIHPSAVDLLSPAYSVYLVVAVTVLSGALREISRFELWRIDAARESSREGSKSSLIPN